MGFFLNKVNLIFWMKRMLFIMNWFDEKMKSFDVKVHKAENYIDYRSRKKKEGDVEEMNEKKETESNMKRIKKDFHGWQFLSII